MLAKEAIDIEGPIIPLFKCKQLQDAARDFCTFRFVRDHCPVMTQVFNSLPKSPKQRTLCRWVIEGQTNTFLDLYNVEMYKNRT